jgi:hypothetical protein
MISPGTAENRSKRAGIARVEVACSFHFKSRFERYATGENTRFDERMVVMQTKYIDRSWRQCRPKWRTRSLQHNARIAPHHIWSYLFNVFLAIEPSLEDTNIVVGDNDW